MSQDLLSQKMSSLQEEVNAAIQRVESFQKAMNLVQQFFYRLLRRPGWL